MNTSNYFIPHVVETTPNGETRYDIYTRLLKDRIVMLTTQVNDEVSSAIVAQLLFLQSEDPDADIYFYINSPGGSVTAGLAMYDTMKMISCDVVTVCMGQAASMGAVLLAGGTKGKRFSLPSSRIMIHQPSGGASGQCSDIQIQAKEIDRLQTILYNHLSADSGKTFDEIEKASNRDNFMSPEEAIAFGLIDDIKK